MRNILLKLKVENDDIINYTSTVQWNNVSCPIAENKGHVSTNGISIDSNLYGYSDPISLPYEFTLSMWINLTNSGQGGDCLIGNLKPYGSFADTCTWSFYTRRTTKDYSSGFLYGTKLIPTGPTSSWVNGEWTLLTITKYRDTILVFRNGILIANADVAPIVFDPYKIYLNRSTENPNYRYDTGVIDDLLLTTFPLVIDEFAPPATSMFSISSLYANDNNIYGIPKVV